MSTLPEETLVDGFYKAHRDTLQEENQQLRDRIMVLEEKIRRAEWAARGVIAELT